MFTFTHRSINISDDICCVLGCGSGQLVRCCKSDDLEANIGFLKDEQGNQILFISVDALYVGALLTNSVRLQLSDLLDPHQIFIAASHSHNAPMLDDTKPLLGEPLFSHVNMIANKIAYTALQVLSEPGTQVFLRPRKYIVNTVVNRRKMVPFSISRQGVSFFRTEQVPNFKNKMVVTSEVIEFVDLDEKTQGVLWVMPCHPTSYPEPDEVSSHFVGEIRRRIRETSGKDDLPLLFFQGASGDLRPPALAKRSPGFRGLLKSLIQPQGFANFSLSDYLNWCEVVWEEFQNSPNILEQSNEHVPATIASRREKIALNELYEYSYRGSRSVECHLVKLGNIELVGLSAEVTWKFRESIISPDVATTIIGCLADTYGYLASKQQREEKGYEVSGFADVFGLKIKDSVFPEQICEKLVRNTLKSD